jgi:outer membrane protein TolC
MLPIEYTRLKPALPVVKTQPSTNPSKITKGSGSLSAEEMRKAPGETAQKTQELTKTPAELSYFVKLALNNNQPTKVAQEEVEFAKMKILEARRNLFPALKLTSYLTSGQIYKVDYEEKEARAQIDQPIYYGGRLGYSLKQAQVNYEISQKNYDRLNIDVRHKTEVSYYNLIAARMGLIEQEALKKEANELLTKMEKLAAAGMVIPLEVSGARSWLEQLTFKLDSIKQDLFMAELTFKQILNIQDKPVIETRLIEAEKLRLDLDSCMAAALKSRPEIYLSEMLIKFNDYGQKVEAIKNKSLTVDLSSSYGQYQGHYKTEPWRSSQNWYVGMKASLPWGANTINNSLSRDQQQPRFGQTSATESTSIAGEINFFDNIKRLSDKKRSDIDLYRSISDFDEAFKTVAFEVQDAFLNYQRAVLQLNTAESETKFRRNEAEITKIRSMVGETSLSSAIGTLYALSDAQSKYVQALANYQISLANLRKATGYGIKI